MTTRKYAWHVHHETLIEPLTEPIKNRIRFIKANKPDDEIETRLRLMRPASAKASKARAAYDKATSKTRAVYDKAKSKARTVYDTAASEAWAELERLHKLECVSDCPWDGKTIFPETLDP